MAAIHARPQDAETWFRAARAALELERYSLAAPLFESCLARDPIRVQAANGLWYSRFRLGEYEKAAAGCERAWQLDPTDPYVAMMRGQLAYMLGDRETGRTMHQRALDLDPEEREPATIFVQLVRGDYERGWRRFAPGAPEQRARQRLRGWEPPQDRVWRGELSPESSVCVYPGGGHGDLYLFARYLPLLAKRVRKVSLVAAAEDVRLLGALGEVAEILQSPEEAEESLFTYLWSLPGIFRTRLETIPWDGPYLRPPATGPVLPGRPALRVGLAWAGHPNTVINADRSIPSPDLLRPLFDLRDVSWVALQVGHRAGEAEDLPFRDRPPLMDFGATAFVLSQLDLLITVDTAIANLAGALGIPAWVLPPTYPEFRWGLQGERTGWYPHVRLFRRVQTGEWEGVIERVGRALSEIVSRTGR